MKELGEKRAKEAIKETDATVPAGKNLLTDAYKTLADTQKENNDPEVVKQVLQQHWNARLVK